MPITDRQRAAESQFRELIHDAGLSPPDRVDYEPDSVVFYWHAAKTAVVVDLDGGADGEPAAAVPA